ncbi:uncharacterized protein LOC144633376 [Oculina patagonica]
MTKDEEEEFQQAKVCYICDKVYNDDDIRVRDHCHITGKFRGSAHQECNLKLRIEPDKIKIPVIFHNLRGYDSHFIMQEIGAIVKKHTYKNKKGEIKEMKINAIPNNMEKYMAFMLGNHLTFLDSFQFMSSSLDKLVSNLPKESLKYTSEIFKGEKLNLMSRKGVYCYDYMDSFDKFNEKLPKKEDFYSILNNEHISDEDYQHVKNVWKMFKINNMGEYHDLYLKSDVLLLSDVFESFRKTCLEYYKLDPCHYFTSPALSWDSMLKMTGIELELMTDIDMHQFIEMGMRGGISYIANRHSKANNKYMDEYDKKSTSKYIMYLDSNNLYGFAMSQYLPKGGFKWLTQKQINETNLAKYKEDSNKGLILEVDLKYPNELHNLHNDYPLGAEKVKVTKDMLSDYCKNIAEKYNISTGLVNKLIPTLNNKEKYVLHYRNLQLYLDLGLKLTKVHRALEFNQSPWLKQYIDYNTEKRKNAKNAFEKDFFKLMNNSVFGKTMENLKKRVDVRLKRDYRYDSLKFGKLNAMCESASFMFAREAATRTGNSTSVSYSNDVISFQDYEEGGYVKIFDGNTDRDTIVRNRLQNPIITRYIRINPISHHGWISLRADFYNCTPAVCQDSLGLENYTIPDSSITASSTYLPGTTWHIPGNGRLHFKSISGRNGAWSAGNRHDNSWFQVDFGRSVKVTMVATQGRQDLDQWVTEYRLSYSNDVISFQDYEEGGYVKIFDGNTDRDTIVRNRLQNPIITRYIRINPISHHGWISLRADFYNCTPAVCQDSLGLENYTIPDSSITASSIYLPSTTWHIPENGRLHFKSISGRYGAWSAGNKHDNSWFQVDFGRSVKVTMVATQGRQDLDQWVTEYRVSYSNDGISFQDYEEGGYVKIFDGNTDRDTIVRNRLQNPIITRYIRINPICHHGWISLRADFYNCTPAVCQDSLGLEKYSIPDSWITASSMKFPDKKWHMPGNGRLHFKRIPRRYGACTAGNNRNNSWFQVHFGRSVNVTMVATQGRQDLDQWVTKYRVSYSNDGIIFQDYEEEGHVKIFDGNTDRDTIFRNKLQNPIITRYIRINPISYYAWISLRAEFYRCTPAGCKNPLGMESGLIPNLAITASSSRFNPEYTATNARLNYKRGSTGEGTWPWIPRQQDRSQWLQVNFGKETQVTGIATQGSYTRGYRVKSYSLRYSNNGLHFQQYPPGSQKKTFSGNTVKNSVVINELVPPIRAQYIRVTPESWHKLIALRLEFYGCLASVPPTTDKKSSSNHTITYVSTSIGILVVLALITGLLIKYCVFCKKSISSPVEFKYHAFIIYNQEDSQWVSGTLLPLLEEKHHLKCCIHYRDFTPGKPFQECMAESVYSSHKIIAVLSSNFLKSNYCIYELNIAKYRLLNRQDDSLVIIRIDKESEGRKLPRELRKRNFIDYSNSLERPQWENRLLRFLNVQNDSRIQDDKAEQTDCENHVGSRDDAVMDIVMERETVL